MKIQENYEVIFKGYPKISRFENELYSATEKIDGTNACIIITENEKVGAQSRTKVLTLDNDNFGFCAWVEEHKDELMALGPGHHFGEWWGKGIQRGYGLDHRRFSLFVPEKAVKIPECCHVVPIVFKGLSLYECSQYGCAALREEGSRAAPGWDRPEGIILYAHLAKIRYKIILDK